MKVLIIGCGYLGLRVAKAALRQGHTVAALTRSPDRAAEWLQIGIQPVIGDVLDPHSLTALPAADVCLYAVGYDRSAQADKRAVYVDGLRNVLSEIPSRIPKLIYISSTSVYGQAAGEIVDESSDCTPDSEGGRICLAAEQLIPEYFPTVGSTPNAVILRLAGLIGPGRLLARKDLLLQGTPLNGLPEAWLNLIHVDDAVQAVMKLATHPLKEHLYLLSDGHPLTRNDFYRALARRIGAAEPIFEPGNETSLNKQCNSQRICRDVQLQIQFPNAIEALENLLTPDDR